MHKHAKIIDKKIKEKREKKYQWNLNTGLRKREETLSYSRYKMITQQSLKTVTETNREFFHKISKKCTSSSVERYEVMSKQTVICGNISEKTVVE